MTILLVWAAAILIVLAIMGAVVRDAMAKKAPPETPLTDEELALLMAASPAELEFEDEITHEPVQLVFDGPRIVEVPYGRRA